MSLDAKLNTLKQKKALGQIPTLSVNNPDAGGSAVVQGVGGVLDASGTRILHAYESMERSADSLAKFANTLNAILTSLDSVSDLVTFNDAENKFVSKVDDFKVALAQAAPQEREGLVKKVVADIDAVMQTINASMLVYVDEIEALVTELQKVKQSLTNANPGQVT